MTGCLGRGPLHAVDLYRVNVPTELSVERDGAIAVVTLRAPDRRNALNVAMADALVAACDEIDADATVGAVVITGEGPYFCAGADRALLAARAKTPRSRSSTAS